MTGNLEIFIGSKLRTNCAVIYDKKYQTKKKRKADDRDQSPIHSILGWVGRKAS